MAPTRALLVTVALYLFIFTFPASGGGIKNGDFEQRPNKDWLREGPNAPRVAPGDRPVVGREQNGNRHGRTGDANGGGASGENPTRIFQRFDCGMETDTLPSCIVKFRYRLTLAPGEVGWVRLSRGARDRLWLLPNTNGNWSGPVSVGLSECGTTTVEFGLSAAAGGNLASVLDIDDAVDECAMWFFSELQDVYTPYPDSLRNIPPPIALQVVDGEEPLAEAEAGGGNMNWIYWAALAIMVVLMVVLIGRRRRTPA